MSVGPLGNRRDTQARRVTTRSGPEFDPKPEPLFPSCPACSSSRSEFSAQGNNGVVRWFRCLSYGHGWTVSSPEPLGQSAWSCASSMSIPRSELPDKPSRSACTESSLPNLQQPVGVPGHALCRNQSHRTIRSLYLSGTRGIRIPPSHSQNASVRRSMMVVVVPQKTPQMTYPDTSAPTLRQ